MASMSMASERNLGTSRSGASRWGLGALALGLLVMLQGCAGTGLFADRRAETPYGDYLAARFAGSVHEGRAAEKYFDRTLAADPDNSVIIERAFMVALNSGDMDRAVTLARRLVKLAPRHRMARLVLSLNAIRKSDYREARAEIGNAETGAFVALVGALTKAWAAAGEGDKALALNELKAFEGKPAFDLFRAYHTALILDMLGDAKGAEESYRQAMDTSGATSIRIVQAYASFLDRQGRVNEARAALDQYIAMAPDHPLAKASLAEIASNKTMKPLIGNAAEGVAEALYGLGSALAQDRGNELSELYLQLSIWMRPDFDVARTLLADFYEQQKRWEDAIAAYDAVAASSPLYQNALIQKALDLNRLDKDAEAIDVLNKAADRFPSSIEPVIALGDVYRGKEKYAEAGIEYTRAIALAGAPKPAHWTLYYARGICNERLGQWPEAERDLKLALKLSDDHPLVLNYLGYSWIEQGVHLTEALAMIEKAVELRPTDGFIVDSLGWAHYRLGDYKQATEYLERAVELEPGDPTINEHLGDAMWKVGRKIEARFQWSHALEMKPEKDRVPLLKKKLEFGLDTAEADHKRYAPVPPGS